MSTKHSILNTSILILIAIILAACGSRTSSSSNAESDGSAGGSSGSAGVAAMPAANFSSVAEQSGITTTTALTESVVADAANDVDLAMGERVFGNKCAECHGSAGEGVDGNGSAIAGTELEFVDFEDLLRTGGELGPDHLFGTRAVSVNGLEAMHAWLTSLQ